MNCCSGISPDQEVKNADVETVIWNGFRWCNIQDFDDTSGICHNFCFYQRLYSNKQTTNKQTGVLVINQTFHYGSEFDDPSFADHSTNEGLIVFDCRPFDNRTFDFVRFTKFLCEFDLIQFPNRIERLLFDFVRSPERSIRYVGGRH